MPQVPMPQAIRRVALALCLAVGGATDAAAQNPPTDRESAHLCRPARRRRARRRRRDREADRRGREARHPGRQQPHPAACRGLPRTIMPPPVRCFAWAPIRTRSTPRATTSSPSRRWTTTSKCSRSRSTAAAIRAPSPAPIDGTALIAAAHLGHVEVVRMLIAAKAPLNHVNTLGWTALLEAIVLGNGGANHTATVEALVQAGADVNLAGPARHHRRSAMPAPAAIRRSPASSNVRAPTDRHHERETMSDDIARDGSRPPLVSLAWRCSPLRAAPRRRTSIPPGRSSCSCRSRPAARSTSWAG